MHIALNLLYALTLLYQKAFGSAVSVFKVIPTVLGSSPVVDKV